MMSSGISQGGKYQAKLHFDVVPFAFSCMNAKCNRN